MNKILFGVLLGAALGVLNGLSAWFTPEVRWALLRIVIGQVIGGMIAGLLVGYFASKVSSLSLGVLFGLAVGLFLAFLVSYMQHGYYVRILIPGAVFGAILGYATQKHAAPVSAPSS